MGGVRSGLIGRYPRTVAWVAASLVYLGLAALVAELSFAGTYSNVVFYALAAVVLLSADATVQRYAGRHVGAPRKPSPRAYAWWASSPLRVATTCVLGIALLALGLDTLGPVSNSTGMRICALAVATMALVIDAARKSTRPQPI